ncbi:MAG: 2-C-methyl-D-erythritol 2,4-cyclodiphosphate synthase [candidate division Zixibacteria bacterium]|nr:2-C-methyl-D-erythritol 2,4-cyclodiphosphate synthase [candidate division Zixibacteria bacterium]
MYRVGIGYDAHKLVRNRNLILGGVKISYSKGLLGHSDADVLSHAIGDALLGSLSLGDLGKHFPDTDKRYKDISSLKLLNMIKKMILKHKGKIENIDSTVLAEEPKLAKYIDKMRQNIAESLDINKDRISIKATTTEGMGFVGRKQGMAAYAIVLINQGKR